MKHIILNILMVFSALSLGAQDLNLDPMSFVFENDGSKESQQIGIRLTNNAIVDFQWTWNIQLGDTWPKEWEVQVCDQTLCWSKGIVEMPDIGSINNLGSQETTVDSTVYIKVFFNNHEANHDLKFCVFEDFDYAQDPLLCSQISTSTENVFSQDIKLFPNPTTDYFKLSDDTHVGKVDVYDIVGKKLKSFDARGDKTFEVSDLRDGLYLVRVMATDGSLLKSMRLSKR